MVPKSLRFGYLVVGTSLSLACVGCTAAPPPSSEITTLPLKPPAAAAPAVSVFGESNVRPTSPSIVEGPSPPHSGETTVESPAGTPILQGPAVNFAAENMPVPAFINSVLGETLHLSFQIDPKVASRSDLVTLRTGGSRSPQELLSITAAVLRNYGIQLVFEKNLVRVRESEALLSESPQIILGRTAPEVSSDLRPIFQIVPLSQVNAQDIAGWLATAYGNKIRFTLSPSNNAIMMLGQPDDIRAAVEAVRLLDQPQFADRRSLRVRPVFWSAKSLTEKLIDVLKAEGINASSILQPPTAVTILPLTAVDTILVFARDQRTLNHIGEWVKTLDQPTAVDSSQNVFYYPVRNTTAESLAKVLNDVLSNEGKIPSDATEAATTAAPRGSGRVQGQDTAQVSRTAEQDVPQTTATQALPPGSRIVTDVPRNALIFIGSPDSYARVRPLMESLDQAPREVLIEVTVVEVQLGDTTDLGIEWQQVVNLGGGQSATIGTLGGLGVPQSGSGFNFTILNGANAVRAVLQTLQTTNKTRVLSTPRLLARSGAEAKIQVGQDVPIVTGQATSSQVVNGGSSDILQQIQYRSTGTILDVKPVIYAGNQIDLDIRQEVSSVAQASISNINSPTINNQNVATQLSLSDGSTVLLGGFISDNKTDNDLGIPVLKDIPVVGNLFKRTHIDDEREELLIFITPYIINSSRDSDQVTNSFQDRMKQWPELRSTLTW
ncbi:MAG TPA: secretin N-terminal domain-containing protein [Stellaceae bacterium]|nr:secretin N-terminal domain-containing protein [Stellaceae bacterium]